LEKKYDIIERLNITKKESSYSTLYDQIKISWQKEGKSPDEMEDIYSVPSTTQNFRVGRNETCPCGSGKKFKFCHGQSV